MQQTYNTLSTRRYSRLCGGADVTSRKLAYLSLMHRHHNYVMAGDISIGSGRQSFQ